MPPLRPSVRLLFFLGCLAAAGTASAEEALVLDNGAILQGHVVREENGVVHFRLSGVGTDSRIEVRRDRIVKRFTTMDPSRPPPRDTAPAPTPLLPEVVGPGGVAAPSPLPAEEPDPTEERFFARLLRLSGLAFPSDAASRAFLAILGLVVVLCLVGIGARAADLEGMTLGRNTALALVLAAIVGADVYWADTLLRADHGAWVIPVQLVGWVALASAVLRCGLGRAVLLLAFVVFTGAVVVFASGALLVLV